MHMFASSCMEMMPSKCVQFFMSLVTSLNSVQTNLTVLVTESILNASFVGTVLAMKIFVEPIHVFKKSSYFQSQKFTCIGATQFNLA